MAKLTWIDKKSVLYHKGRTFKAGDNIPAGILPDSRIESFIKQKKIVEGEIKVDKTVKQTTLFNTPVESKVIQHEEVIEDKPKKTRKSKAELEEEELLKAIEAEERLKKIPVESDLMTGLMGGKGATE